MALSDTQHFRLLVLLRWQVFRNSLKQGFKRFEVIARFFTWASAAIGLMNANRERMNKIRFFIGTTSLVISRYTLDLDHPLRSLQRYKAMAVPSGHRGKYLETCGFIPGHFVHVVRLDDGCPNPIHLF